MKCSALRAGSEAHLDVRVALRFAREFITQDCNTINGATRREVGLQFLGGRFVIHLRETSERGERDPDERALPRERETPTCPT